MKKILTLLAIALVGLTSCKKEPTKVYSISIDPTELSFAAAGGEETVEVTSSAEWELSGESYWCYASSYSGKGNAEILFSADPNEDSESSRSATFTFISGDKKATLTVTQEKKEYSISIEPTELTFGADGGDQIITVTSSDSWEVKGESDWCDISATTGKNGDKVTFSAAQYTNTEEARTATYTFVCGDKEAELKIEQEAKVYSISVEPATLTYDVEGGEQTVTITSSDEWTAAYPTDHKDWLKVSSVEGENGAKVNITVEKSDSPEIRYSCVSFYCGDKKADVTIEQAAKEYSISIEPSEITFAANGEEKEVIVSSSDEWELTTDCDWIQTSASKGNNGTSVKITASFNNTSKQRTGTIVFTCGNKTAELKLTQEANNFSISLEPSEITFGAEGGKQTIEVSSSHEWTLTNDSDWITTSIDKGESGSSVDISVAYSTSTENKSGEIIFTCGDKTAVLKVTQESDGSPVIQFKDPYFLAAIIDQADINGDGQITEKEAASVKVLTTATTGNRSRNIDELKYFTNLEDLTLASLDIDTEDSRNNIDLDLSFFKNLHTFTLQTPIKNLKATEHSSLQKVIFSSWREYSAIDEGDAASVDFSNCVTLTTIDGISCDELIAVNCTALNSITGSATKANLTGCTALKEIYAYENNLGSWFDEDSFWSEEYNLTGCTGLTKIDIQNRRKNFIVNCSGCSSLVELSCFHSGIEDKSLSELILDGCYSLKKLDCTYNLALKSLDLSDSPALSYLSISGTGISFLDLSNNPEIATLDCYYCKYLTSLDVSNLHGLTTLYCDNSMLKSLDLSNNTALTKLECNETQLTSLDLSNNTALTELYCNDNQIKVLDLSNNRNLDKVSIRRNPLEKLLLYKYNTISSGDIKSIENEYGDILEYVE